MVECGTEWLFKIIFLYWGSNLPLELVRHQWPDVWSELRGCSCDHQTNRSLGLAWRENQVAATCESAALQTWRRHNPIYTHTEEVFLLSQNKIFSLQHYVIYI